VEKPACWVGTWSSAQQLADDPQPALADVTVRQTVHASIGGTRIRLRFSNVFGADALPIAAAVVALPVEGRAGVSAIRVGTSHRLTFVGRPSVVVPAGAEVVSDPVDFPLESGSNATVTVYLAEGQASHDITSHPGSRTTSYLLAGNHVDDAELPGATPVDHWYFLSGVEVWTDGGTAAVVMLGDSLTDGRGSTTNRNDRWPDQLRPRLPARVAVLNQAIGGNRVLNDGLGPCAVSRLDRDVLAQNGVRWLVVFEGVNDIGTAAATQAAQKQVLDDLTAAYQQIVTRAHAHGILVYGATLTPFGANTAYDDPSGLREAARHAVNGWIRTGGTFDAVIDFDLAVRDPSEPRRLLDRLHEGDHLHLNPAGYKVLADAVPARLFA
jgi:lysophospholipase L1-like esterase